MRRDKNPETQCLNERHPPPGLLANGSRAGNLARARAFDVPRSDAIPDEPKPADAAEPPTLPRPCPCCGGRMLIIETFARAASPSIGQPPRPS